MNRHAECNSERRAPPCILLLALALLLVSPLFAQDSRPDLAARLTALVDQRVEALRIELHAEIDRALGGAPDRMGLVLKPASDEFRELHRLDPRQPAWLVETVRPDGVGAGVGLEPRDVLLVRPESIEEDARRTPMGPVLVRIVRNHERT